MDRLLAELRGMADYLILDLRRVQSVDITAAHTLNVVGDVLAERKVPLLFANVSERLPNGRNLREFLELSGLDAGRPNVQYMPSLEAAIEWVESQLLGDVESVETHGETHDRPPLELHEIELFKGSKPDTLVDLEACLEKRSWKAGETIYQSGDTGSELMLIRKGQVKLVGAVGRSGAIKHIATLGRGDFIGGQAFLENRIRSSDAIATRDCDMYVLSVENYNLLAEDHKRIALVLMTKLARLLSIRLRHTNEELALLQDT